MVFTKNDSERLLDSARENDFEQSALIDSADDYNDILANYVAAKQEQVEHIEKILEQMINHQKDAVQRNNINKPGLLTMPGKRRDWQAQHINQQTRLNVLLARLEMVREIKDGMGLHSPRIEEMAERKLRFSKPDLTEKEDNLRETAMRHIILQRKAQNEPLESERKKGIVLSRLLKV